MKPLTKPQDFPSATNFSYLNAANVSLMFNGAEEKIHDWFGDLSKNGSNNFTEEVEENVFKALHQAAANLINAEPNEISAGSSATELLSSLAWAISPRKGKNIVSTSSAFPSTVYPWMRVTNSTGAEIRLADAVSGFTSIDDIKKLVNRETEVVCISHTEYNNGQTYDLIHLAEIAHQNDAILVVDATQSAGAIPIDVQQCPIDVLVTGAYKWLCGPFGSAFMYIRHNLANQLEPGLVGFRSHDNMWDLDAARIRYKNDASRFEFSTTAFGCAIGLTQSIEYLNAIGANKIYDYNLFLSDYLIEGLKKLDAIITTPLNQKERSPIITAYFENIDSVQLIKALKSAKVFVSSRKESIRFSPHLYNSKEDIELAISTIGENI
tara:strand:- start:13759 stop:14898 length:1140 start_codon:yes stop_codon:yes gene_type:complete